MLNNHANNIQTRLATYVKQIRSCVYREREMEKTNNNHDRRRNNNLTHTSSKQTTKRTCGNETQRQTCKHTAKQTTHTKHTQQHDIPQQTHKTNNSSRKALKHHVIQ